MNIWAKRIVVAILIVGLITFVAGWYGQLKIDGRFEQWQSLDTPPEQTAKIYVHKGLVPFVATNDNEYYLCAPSLYKTSENCWVRVHFSVLDQQESFNCHPNYQFKVPKPPSEILDMVEFQSCEGGFSSATTQRNFAILSDGSVWEWQHSVSDMDYLTVLLYRFYGGFLGIFATMIIFIGVDRYKDKSSQKMDQ